MSDQEKASILSQLPVKDLDDLRLALSISYMIRKDEVSQKWVETLSKSLEVKQADILKGYDDNEYEQMTGI